MKNTISVFVGSDEFECVQFNGGVDVYEASTNHLLGNIDGLDIPDPDDTEETIKFNEEVENWLNENYF